jgi:peptidoglycan-associated lipoprotein
MFNKTPFILAASALSAALLAGCASSGEKDTSASTSQSTQAPISTAPVTTSGTSGAEVNALDTSKHSVYFDFDKSDIKPDGQPVISNWASYLSSHPTTKVRLEGNCDERGTREYNVGLGERRGNAVAQALEAAGVSASQVSVVSYGKERPVCTQHNEACWSQNRRVDLVKQ